MIPPHSVSSRPLPTGRASTPIAACLILRSCLKRSSFWWQSNTLHCIGKFALSEPLSSHVADAHCKVALLLPHGDAGAIRLPIPGGGLRVPSGRRRSFNFLKMRPHSTLRASGLPALHTYHWASASPGKPYALHILHGIERRGVE